MMMLGGGEGGCGCGCGAVGGGDQGISTRRLDHCRKKKKRICSCRRVKSVWWVFGTLNGTKRGPAIRCLILARYLVDLESTSWPKHNYNFSLDQFFDTFHRRPPPSPPLRLCPTGDLSLSLDPALPPLPSNTRPLSNGIPSPTNRRRTRAPPSRAVSPPPACTAASNWSTASCRRPSSSAKRPKPTMAAAHAGSCASATPKAAAALFASPAAAAASPLTHASAAQAVVSAVRKRVRRAVRAGGSTGGARAVAESPVNP